MKRVILITYKRHLTADSLPNECSRSMNAAVQRSCSNQAEKNKF